MTYCKGPYLNFHKIITKSEFLRICEELTESLNSYYTTYYPTYPFNLKVVPEPITEGGFLIQFYDKVTNERLKEYYKTMRVFNGNFPYVDPDFAESWKNSDEIVYKPTIECVRTVLKAFDKAPRWTSDEIKMFLHVFSKFMIEFDKGFPKDKFLDSNINNYDSFVLKPANKYIKSDDLYKNLPQFRKDNILNNKTLEVMDLIPRINGVFYSIKSCRGVSFSHYYRSCSDVLHYNGKQFEILRKHNTGNSWWVKMISDEGTIEKVSAAMTRKGCLEEEAKAPY